MIQALIKLTVVIGGKKHDEGDFRNNLLVAAHCVFSM